MRWVFKAFLDLATWNWRRPDVVLFINGLPLVVIELKNAADENATVWSAFQQLQTCQQQIGGLCYYNAVLVKRILNRYGYPPDLQEEAVRTVLAQAELVCADWAV